MKEKQIKKTLFVGMLFLVFGAAFAVLAQNANESGSNVFKDFDQDGLSNQEEEIYKTDPHMADTDGDGYSDYTEISSGYDPLKPAPGDKIITQTDGPGEVVNADGSGEANLTHTAVAQITSLVTTNDLNALEVDVEDIDDMVQAALSQGITDITLPEIDVDAIKVKEQDYKDNEEGAEKIREDTEEYIAALTYIFSTNAGQQSNSYSDLTSWMRSIIQKASNAYTAGNYDYIEDLSSVGEDMLEQLGELTVPENMLDVHIKGLQLANYALAMKDVGEPDSDDPLKNIAELARAQGLIAIVTDFLLEVENKLYEVGLESIPLEEFKFDFSEREE